MEKNQNIIIIIITDPFSKLVAVVAILLDTLDDEDVIGKTGTCCGGNIRVFTWSKILIYNL